MKQIREQLRELFDLALKARCGDEDARRQMKEKHGVKNPADYTGFMLGVNESLELVDSIQTD